MPHRQWAIVLGRGVAPGWVVSSFAAVYLLLSLLGQSHSQLPVLDSLAFLACVVLAFYVPGSLVLSLVGDPPANPLCRAVLAVALGSVVLPPVYGAIRESGLDYGVVWALVFLLAMAWALLHLQRRKSGQIAETVALEDAIALGCLLLMALLLLCFSHFGDVSFIEDGFLINTSYLTESVYHIGIINSLLDMYPPPALYASGSSDFSYYHLGMHLQIEMIARMSGVATLPLATYYFPFLYFGLLMSLPFVFVRTIGGSALLAAVSGILVFGSDFSYIPGLLLNNAGDHWTLYFATTIWSLFTLNGYIPAVITLFTCLVVLWRYLERGQAGHLVIFSACVIAGFGFKTSLGLQLAAATAATGAAWVVLDRRDRRDRRGRYLLLTGILLSAGLLVWSLRIDAGTEAVQLRLMPLSLFHSTIDKLGLASLDVVSYPFLIGLFVLGGLGVRALGLWMIPGFVKERTTQGWLGLFILLFVAGGYLLSEFLFLGRPGGQNNSVWFYVQSLMAAWFALFAYLARGNLPGGRAAWLSLGLLIVAAPSTLQFLYHRSAPEYRLIGADESAVIEFLKSTDPGSVVLHPLNLDTPSLASNFAGRSSVLNVFRSFVVKEDGLFDRAADIDRFFDADSPETQRLDVLVKYGVDYVYMPVEMQQRFPQVPGMHLELQTDTISVFHFGDAASGSEARPPGHEKL